MMSDDPRDRLLEEDLGTLWDTLPEAPPLVARPAQTQITLRLPAGCKARIRRVADSSGLPYHALARAWLIDGLRERAEPHAAGEPGAQPEQLNLKLDQELLDQLKLRGHELGRPHHALARELITESLQAQEQRLGITPAAPEPAIKDLMVLLLHAPNARGQDAVRGITRMQKLLYVLERNLTPGSEAFSAHNYGPFSKGVNDAAEALRLAGFLTDSEHTGKGPPSLDEMLASAKRSLPAEGGPPADFALSEAGHDAAERLRHSDPAHESLYENVSRLRREWDDDELIERVYETWPESTENSLIRDEVDARRRQRRRK